MRRGPRNRRFVVWATVAALALFLLVPGPAAAAGTATIRIDPASQSVSQGSTFTVHVVESSQIKTSGTQATLVFDKTKLAIQSVSWGSGVGSPITSVPAKSAGFGDAISTANGSGKLASVMAAYAPPGGVAAGDQDFLDVTFKATGCGQVSLTLPVGPTDGLVSDGTDDGWGNDLTVTTTGASVTITDCGSGGQGDQGSQGGGQQADQGGQPTDAQAGSTQATQDQTGGQDAAATQAAAGNTAGDGSAAGNDQSGSNGGGGAGGNNSPTSNLPGSPKNPPLWVPIIVAIPAVAVIWLGLRKWRLATAE